MFAIYYSQRTIKIIVSKAVHEFHYIKLVEKMLKLRKKSSIFATNSKNILENYTLHRFLRLLIWWLRQINRKAEQNKSIGKWWFWTLNNILKIIQQFWNWRNIYFDNLTQNSLYWVWVRYCQFTNKTIESVKLL